VDLKTGARHTAEILQPYPKQARSAQLGQRNKEIAINR
jgi:hypothetical protein